MQSPILSRMHGGCHARLATCHEQVCCLCLCLCPSNSFVLHQSNASSYAALYRILPCVCRHLAILHIKLNEHFVLVNNLHLKNLEQDRWPGTFFTVMPDVKPPSKQNEHVFYKIYVVKTFDLIGARGPSLLAKTSPVACRVGAHHQPAADRDGWV